jgi:hypothetical protein
MPNKKYYKLRKKAAESYERLPPPRSQKYAMSSIVSEKTVRIGDNRYLMRSMSCGGTELVRYDEVANKWAVLCFDGEKCEKKAA